MSRGCWNEKISDKFIDFSFVGISLPFPVKFPPEYHNSAILQRCSQLAKGRLSLLCISSGGNKNDQSTQELSLKVCDILWAKSLMKNLLILKLISTKLISVDWSMNLLSISLSHSFSLYVCTCGCICACVHAYRLPSLAHLIYISLWRCCNKVRRWRSLRTLNVTPITRKSH